MRVFILLFLALSFNLHAQDRSVVAIKKSDGVYLSWRLFPKDSSTIAFNVYSDVNGTVKLLNTIPISKTTDFLDKVTTNLTGTKWFVRPVNSDGSLGTASLKMGLMFNSATQSYYSIPYDTVNDKKATSAAGFGAFADVDGDGLIDITIKKDKGTTDPWPPYWHSTSTSPYHLYSYSMTGKLLSSYNFGPGIERGVWYSPYAVFDLDGDGKAELITKDYDRTKTYADLKDSTGRVTKGSEYVSVYDAKSMQLLAKADWVDRNLFLDDDHEHGEPGVFDVYDYNNASRNLIAIAYLDGVNPHIIVQRGTYRRIYVDAYKFTKSPTPTLTKVWSWDNVQLGISGDRDKSTEQSDLLKSSCDRGSSFCGKGAHTIKTVDIDGDGKDEVVLGMIALDHDGKMMWMNHSGHPDHIYIADFIPERPGLEMYFGLETGQQHRGMGVLDVKTKKLILAYSQSTSHIHNEGLCSDIDKNNPGIECLSGEEKNNNGEKIYLWSMKPAEPYINNSTILYHNMTLLEKNPFENNIKAWGLHWDADDQREVFYNKQIISYEDTQRLVDLSDITTDYTVLGVADIVGDWREELIVSTKQGIRIYISSIPSTTRRKWLMGERYYRNEIANMSMGYAQTPMYTSNNPVSYTGPNRVNLLKNPGFESQIQDWINWGNSRASTYLKVSGKYSGVTTTEGGGLAQEVMTSLKVGKTYRLVGNSRLNPSGGQGWFGIKILDSTGKVLLEKSAVVTTTNFTQYTVEFKVPTGASKAQVYTWINKGVSNLYIDDVTLVLK